MLLNISDQTWEMFVTAVKKGAKVKAQWESPKQKKKYRIFDIWPDRILVKREKGNNSRILETDLNNLLNAINKTNGELKRATYKLASVAQLSTMVNFHPNLFWSEDFDWVLFSANNSQAAVQYKDFGPPPDDDVTELQNFARRVRKGQTRFRVELMKIYNNRCCISNEAIEELLEACHIEPHAKNGINQLSNGLLLRADFHLLFDTGLLFIEPAKHLIHLHPRLKKTEYFKYQLRPVNKRAGGGKIDENYLRAKWKEKAF